MQVSQQFSLPLYNYIRALISRGQGRDVGGPADTQRVILRLQWALMLSGAIVMVALVANSAHTGLTDGGLQILTTIVVLLTSHLILTQSRQLGKENQRLNTLLQIDPLTHIMNRRAALEAAQREIERSRRTHSALAFIVIDIDRFKRINDEHGHPVGDLILEEFADLSASCLRSIDTFARTGGEEFLVILPDSNHSDATSAIERMRKKLEDHAFNVSKEYTLGISISAGITICNPSGEINDSKSLVYHYLEQADKAMYIAKRAGGNQIRVSVSPSLSSLIRPN
jgi:diguanylate cyclase (GGDEF)-like protein